MVSSVPLLPSILDKAPRKHHLLTLPFEIRHNILDYACMDAEISFCLGTEWDETFSYWQKPWSYPIRNYCGPSQYSLLLVCSQLYSNARPLLAKRLSLRIDHDLARYSRGHVQHAVNDALCKSPSIPPFLKYARNFLAYARLKPLREVDDDEATFWNRSWLTNAFPNLHRLHLGIFMEPIDIFTLHEERVRQVRQIATDAGLAQSWKGHLAVQTLNRRIENLCNTKTPKEGTVRIEFDICIRNPDADLTESTSDEATYVVIHSFLHAEQSVDHADYTTAC